MKTKLKKYPLLVSSIISCVIIVASLFILGFFGLKLGTSLGGGSQFEISVPTDVSTKDYVAKIKDVLKDNDLTFDSSMVEDKYNAIDDDGNFTKRVIVVKISQINVADDVEADLISDLSTTLKVDKSYISNIDDIMSLTTAKNVLRLGIAIAIIAAALFVFAWIRYSIFAGLSFILAFLHNIILYFSLIILTRIELNLVSITVALVLTLVMTIVLIHIFEKYRREAKLHISDNLSISERMIKSESESIKPFLIVLCAIVIVIAFMLFVPANAVKMTALNMFVALLVTAYTSLLIGPASYVALLELSDVRRKAILSRNDTVNKVIKKKIKRSLKQQEDAKAREELQKESKTEVVETKAETVEEKQPKKKTYANSKSTKKKGSKKNTWSKK